MFCAWPFYTPETDAILLALLTDAAIYKYVVVQGEMPGQGCTGTSDFVHAVESRGYRYNADFSATFPATDRPWVNDRVHVWERG